MFDGIAAAATTPAASARPAAAAKYLAFMQ
jgi:hypothetical protein